MNSSASRLRIPARRWRRCRADQRWPRTNPNANANAPAPAPGPFPRLPVCAGRNACARWFSVDASSSSSSTTLAFDRDLKRKQRDNAARSKKAWRSAPPKGSGEKGGDNNDDDDDDAVDYDYFRNEMAARLVDRLDDIKRAEGFPLALDIGAGGGHIYRAICSDDAFEGEGGIGGVRKMVLLDSSAGMLGTNDGDDDDGDGEHIEGSHRCGAYKLHADEEEDLPFPDGTFDLVMSSQAIHWVNDLPKLFREVHRVLKPDGCFMFSMIGGATLPELRVSMVLAELEREGGVGAHVGPFVELSDVGSLMQNAGFSLPTIDVDTVRISYPSAPVLMEHLQRMGEGNASVRRREHTGRDVFLAASCIYDELYPLGDPGGDGGGEVEATAQVIFAIGWTPHASQQKPEPRGSATHRIGDVVTVTEHKGEDEDKP
ncbi:unnamed protein product [Pseudo-nitzschia multistriata]|uniref:Methyltransferase type 11 domain-containing protein n=1 Tax=Pseudo-nitzschia multistriata TaxID=183589 RepID=A0A448Z1S4_9STRA|nr:unnamed protein product [Pseudo-nitzschia multistriata]